MQLLFASFLLLLLLLLGLNNVVSPEKVRSIIWLACTPLELHFHASLHSIWTMPNIWHCEYTT